MSLAIIGVAGTVIGAGATAYSAYSQQKTAKAAATANANGLHLGVKPVAARYRPVDFTDEQKATIQGNMENLGPITQLTAHTNANITADALRRARTMMPNYDQNMKLEGMATNSLLQGQLPYDDVLDIMAKSGATGNAMGTPGGSAPATLRDLGISRLSAIQSGAGMMKGMVDIADQINPSGHQMLPQSMMLNPLDRIQTAIQQNQLIQQSDQNANNIAAGASPTDAANAQLALSGRLAGGSSAGQGQAAAGYAQALQGLLSGLGKAYTGSSGGTPNYGNPSGAVPAGYQSFRPGPQNGTYYMPSTSIAV